MNGNSREDQENIYLKNKNINNEKIQFSSFLVYSLKSEIHLNSFLSLIYWVSILEIFLYMVGLCLFISSPKNYGIFWIFTPHVLRATLGFIILRKVPYSHTVIETIGDNENNTITDVEKNIIQTYKNLLSNSESTLRPLLITYFILTIIDIIVDNIGFLILQMKWDDEKLGLRNFILVCMIVIFFCNIQFLF